MACCDITCRSCQYFFQENVARECPQCGSKDLHKVFDEPEHDFDFYDLAETEDETELPPDDNELEIEHQEDFNE